ncbi:MAG: YlmC/YmxH family sporulation protein [Lachnospiraceae bacterium]|nr:YlmC/YmxH family sporulation protein [Lachnospiraceae bacterium]
MRICDLKCREVINIRDCRRLGYVGEIEFDLESGCILAIIVPGPAAFCGFLCREKEFVIPFCCIRQVGPDIILVDVDEKEVAAKCRT